MREPQHKHVVEFGEVQEATELDYFIQRQPIVNDLDLGWIHMHTLLIQDVSQILNSLHVKGTLLQIGIQLLFSHDTQDLLNVLQMFLPIFSKDEDVIHIYDTKGVCEWTQYIIHHLHECVRGINSSLKS
jgi:hypothetical protein